MNCPSNCHTVDYETDVKQHRLLADLSVEQLDALDTHLKVRIKMYSCLAYLFSSKMRKSCKVWCGVHSFRLFDDNK